MTFATELFLPGLVAAGDVAALLKVVMFIVVIAIYAINHLLSGIKKLPPGQPPVKPPGHPNPAEGKLPAGQPSGSSDLNIELNEFLKRAAAKRQEVSSRGPTSPPLPGAQSPVPRPRKRRKPEQSAAASASLARPVDEPLSQRQLPKLDTRLTGDLVSNLNTLSGDSVGEHIREVFNRQVGNLAPGAEAAPGISPVPAPELAPTAAAELAALLQDPQSLRGAIILNEILTRPEQRW